jgi:hypothetical protein
MSDNDKARLLRGPYRAPPLAVGDRVTCLIRGPGVVIIGWSQALIPWPLCRPVGRRGHPSLLVTAALARAIRTESAQAVRHWWSVSAPVVTCWRKALGAAGKAGTEGSRRLAQAAVRKAAAAVKATVWTAAERQRRRERAIRLNFASHLQAGRTNLWTEAELALLGTQPDDVIARRIGRTFVAVRTMRIKQGIAPAGDRRKNPVRRQRPTGTG